MTTSSNIAFGNALRELRRSANVSQYALADKSGLDRSYISLLERGRRSPSFDSILKLSVALGIPSVVLVARAEQLLKQSPSF